MRAENASKILVGVDGSEGSRLALTWAMDEATSREADLVASYAWHVPTFAYSSPGFAPIVADEVAEEGRKMLNKVLADLEPHSDVKVELQVKEGPTAGVLRDLASDPSVSLVVVGSRGRGTATGMLLGSVSHALSHDCPKPLVIIPHQKGSATLAPRVGHIVVGTDGSEGADLALRWAAEDAKRRDALLEVVTVGSLMAEFFSPDADPIETVEAIVRKGAEGVLAKAVHHLRPADIRMKLTAEVGRAADVLVERAESADLLVVGSRGLGRARELFLGSVSHSCAHQSLVPVVIVPYA